MDDFLGSNVGGAVTTTVPGLLSTDLKDSGYPVTMKEEATGDSLGELFGRSGQKQVNHLFIKSTYEESGYFEFDSCQNFATLVPDGADPPASSPPVTSPAAVTACPLPSAPASSSANT